MATLESIFGTAPEKEAGIWMEFGPLRVKIASAANNEKLKRVAAAKWKPHRRQIDLDIMDKKLERKILAEIYAECVILGWEGVDDTDGRPLPCTKENVVAKLLALSPFFDVVITEANRLKNFRAEEQEADAGNS